MKLRSIIIGLFILAVASASIAQAVISRRSFDPDMKAAMFTTTSADTCNTMVECWIANFISCACESQWTCFTAGVTNCSGTFGTGVGFSSQANCESAVQSNWVCSDSGTNGTGNNTGNNNNNGGGNGGNGGDGGGGGGGGDFCNGDPCCLCLQSGSDTDSCAASGDCVTIGGESGGGNQQAGGNQESGMRNRDSTVSNQSSGQVWNTSSSQQKDLNLQNTVIQTPGGSQAGGGINQDSAVNNQSAGQIRQGTSIQSAGSQASGSQQGNINMQSIGAQPAVSNQLSIAGQQSTGPRAASLSSAQLEQGVSGTLKQGESIGFTIGGEKHSLETARVMGGSAVFVIRSEPKLLELDIGQTKRVDIDGDGSDDMEVTLNSINTNGDPNITVKSAGKTGERSYQQSSSMRQAAPAAAGQTDFTPQRIPVRWTDEKPDHRIFDFRGSGMPADEIRDYLAENRFRTELDYRASMAIDDERGKQLTLAGFTPVAAGDGGVYLWGRPKQAVGIQESEVADVSSYSSVPAVPPVYSAPAPQDPYQVAATEPDEEPDLTESFISSSPSAADSPVQDSETSDGGADEPVRGPDETGAGAAPDEGSEYSDAITKFVNRCKEIGRERGGACGSCMDAACREDPVGALDSCFDECVKQPQYAYAEEYGQAESAPGFDAFDGSADQSASYEDSDLEPIDLAEDASESIQENPVPLSLAECMRQGNQDSFQCATCLKDACRQDPEKALDYCHGFCAVETGESESGSDGASEVIYLAPESATDEVLPAPSPAEGEEAGRSEEPSVFRKFIIGLFGGGPENRLPGSAPAPDCLACKKCGSGLFNVCDRNECEALGSCAFGLFVCSPDKAVCE